MSSVSNLIAGRVDRGSGPALVLLPGLPGRCEWFEPAIAALARRFRVLSLSFTAVPTDRFFDRVVDRIDGLITAAGVNRALVAGVSFGGLVAAVYGGRRPDRVSHLALASAPSPRYQLDRRSAGYLERPTLSLPLFALQGAVHIGPELAAALPSWRDRATFAAWYGFIALRYPGSPRRMAAWVSEWTSSDLTADVRRIIAPTVVVTGDATLDRVVPVSSSLDYLTLVPGARHVVMPHTGHLGSIMHPDAFADVVAAFAGATPLHR